MNRLEKDVIRMELQTGQLISIVANLNERILELENNANNKNTFFVNNIREKRTPENT
ncbi:hypothetical protein [Sporosarcina sp. FA9]|uniref:hypothetical protein n=1 Tax=Sporosarcina sp. FA9 TaxID=3413030 RepID=UPI003F65C717